jgi:hypothetical protein
MVSSFVIIENDLGSNRQLHFQNPHQIIGLTIVILTFLQVPLSLPLSPYPPSLSP